LRNKERT